MGEAIAAARADPSAVAVDLLRRQLGTQPRIVRDRSHASAKAIFKAERGVTTDHVLVDAWLLAARWRRCRALDDGLKSGVAAIGSRPPPTSRVTWQ